MESLIPTQSLLTLVLLILISQINMSPERKYTLFILTDIFIWEIPRKMQLNLNTGFKEMWHRIFQDQPCCYLKKVQVPVVALTDPNSCLFLNKSLPLSGLQSLDLYNKRTGSLFSCARLWFYSTWLSEVGSRKVIWQ